MQAKTTQVYFYFRFVEPFNRLPDWWCPEHEPEPLIMLEKLANLKFILNQSAHQPEAL